MTRRVISTRKFCNFLSVITSSSQNFPSIPIQKVFRNHCNKLFTFRDLISGLIDQNREESEPQAQTIFRQFEKFNAKQKAKTLKTLTSEFAQLLADHLAWKFLKFLLQNRWVNLNFCELTNKVKLLMNEIIQLAREFWTLWCDCVSDYY